MQRYFIPNDNWIYDNQSVLIEGDDFHHIVNVMRMVSGDAIIGCNENEQSYQLILDQIDESQKQLYATIDYELNEDTELPVHISVAQGLPKGDKLDTIVQKGTELGMRSFIPLQMDRSIVKWDRKKQPKKIDRLKKIAKEASEQSHRLMIPHIHSLQSLDDVIDFNHFDKIIVASEYEAKGSHQPARLLDDLMQLIKGQHRVLIIIGPEGGISPHELAKCEDAGVLPARLGKRILRTETASLYLLSVISYSLEETN
ncbi:16S rRNA (uracil1498-N3)-methyltransferase [Alkalibacillus flavidus]|uniref:Ribosomal RNA small subunit methyltransferase E n=1 Tax=Alkalibacillus flavidus TaxID=546021 RepID=A0ABV2KS89_9BACI